MQTRQVYKVSEVTRDIKLLLENTFGQIWVEGEISNFKAHPSGHFYFSLKDENAILAGVMFARANKDLKFKLEDGQKVICFGDIGVYEPRGQYQLVIEKIQPQGVGSLQLALEQLKLKLEKEGLFDPGRKRQIPYLPRNIGLVTSSAGAALKDILKVLERRFKDTHIILNPVRVQGQGAKEEIAQAIEGLNLFNQQARPQDRIEVMIVGRGGGSIEDLWAFNEEVVARAIYNSVIPVISAVGHERDWTIADLVADLRAATPSAAAELVIPRKEDLSQRLDELTERLVNAFLEMAAGCKENMENLIRRLSLGAAHIRELNSNGLISLLNKLNLLNPAALIPRYQEKVLGLAKQIYVQTEHFLKIQQAEFLKFSSRLSDLNPLNILNRGYSVTFSQDGTVIKEASSIRPGTMIQTKVHKGEIFSKVTEVKQDG